MTQADELLPCPICKEPLPSKYSSAGRSVELGYVGGNGKMRTYHETCVAKAIAGIIPHPDTAAVKAAVETLFTATTTFSYYEGLHLGKTPPDTEKAARNRQMADQCAAAYEALRAIAKGDGEIK